MQWLTVLFNKWKRRILNVQLKQLNGNGGGYSEQANYYFLGMYVEIGRRLYRVS